MNPARLQRILRQHLQTDQLLGAEAVPVGDRPARVVGPAVPAATPTMAVTPAIAEARAAGAAPTGDPAPAPSPPQIVSQPAGTAGPTLPPAPVGAGSPLFATAPGAAANAASAGRAKPLDRATKIRILADMDNLEVKGCTKCPLCQGRTNTVFGEGDPDAGLLFIGEGPGENEDLKGRPFVGRAGELLDKMIVAMGLKREEVFIANVVKCRPPGNRAPTPVETQTCWDYLRRQIQTINPKVIVTLGGPATKTLLDTQTGITALRGTWQWFTGLQPEGPAIAVMPTFHPAFLLRSYTPDNRKKVWSDLRKVMEKLREE